MAWLVNMILDSSGYGICEYGYTTPTWLLPEMEREREREYTFWGAFFTGFSGRGIAPWNHHHPAHCVLNVPWLFRLHICQSNHLDCQPVHLSLLPTQLWNILWNVPTIQRHIQRPILYQISSQSFSNSGESKYTTLKSVSFFKESIDFIHNTKYMLSNDKCAISLHYLSFKKEQGVGKKVIPCFSVIIRWQNEIHTIFTSFPHKKLV